MYTICGGLRMVRFKIECKYLINFLCINMNTNDYQFHPQYHRPMASIIYLANWWIFLGMMIVVAPIRIIMFISRQANVNDLYITLCWIYIVTKVMGYSSDIVVEDMGRVDYNQPLMKNYSIGYWNREKFIYY